MNLKILVLGSVLLLGGCATTAPTFDQQPTSMVAPEQDWAFDQKAATALADSLLTLFDDAALTELVALSQQQNLSLLQQKAATDALAAAVTQADAASSPELSINQNSSRQDNGTALSETHSLTLDAKWELDLWGKLSTQSKTAVANFEASKLSYHWLKASIAAQTMQAYVNAVTQAQQLELSEEKVLSFDKTLNVVTAKFKAGTADLDELTEARQNLGAAEADRIESELAQRNAVRTLQLLTGDYPDGLDLPGTKLPALLSAPDAQVPASILAQRPDVQSAWFSVKSASSSVVAAKAARLPNISLTGQFGNSSDALKDLLSGNTLWSLASSIGYTLFDQGALKAEVAASQSLAEQSYYQYLETVLDALNEVETALDTEQSHYKLEKAQREVVKQARLLLANSEQDYRNGSVDMTDWLMYQRSYFNEQSALIETVNQRLQNRVSLGLALGLAI